MLAELILLGGSIIAFPSAASEKTEAEEQVYFEILDEEGQKISESSRIKEGDVIQLKMYLAPDCGAQMMQLLVSYDNTLVENVDLYDEEQAAFSECMENAVFEDAMVNPRWPDEDKYYSYYEYYKYQDGSITEGGLLATFRYKVISDQTKTVQFEIASENEGFVFADAENVPVEFHAGKAAVSINLPEQILYGDVNQDGKVNLKDASVIYAALAGRKNLTEEAQKAADVNGNGVMDKEDAKKIYAYVAGRITSLEIQDE